MRTFLSTLGGVMIIAMFCAFAPAAPASAPAGVEHPVDLDALHLLQPFWKGDTSWREGLYFIQEADGQPPSARLIFPPLKVLSLTSASGEVIYEEGKDFLVDAKASRLTLPSGSRIPFRRRAEMYLLKGSKNSIAAKAGEPNTALYFGEGTFYHLQQEEVTYTHGAGLWKGFVPKFAGADLPATLAKLKARQDLSVCLMGDSITAGGNASRKSPPYMPAYGELACLGLAKVFGGKVSVTNLAKGGAITDYGVQMAPKIIETKPDLVIIAFGMNDIGYRNAKRYKDSVAKIIAAVKAACPNAEFILVATMRANPEWAYTQVEQFPKYRDALAELCGKGVALADVTSLWTDLFQFKYYHDLTGNGVNHANDFGHRLYAQTVLSLLVEDLGGK